MTIGHFLCCTGRYGFVRFVRMVGATEIFPFFYPFYPGFYGHFSGDRSDGAWLVSARDFRYLFGDGDTFRFCQQRTDGYDY